MKFSLIFLLLFIAGCSSGIPDHYLIELNTLDKPEAFRQIAQYNETVLKKADIVSSITFNFRGRSLSALGITELDTESNSFSVAALSPMGLTLFKLKKEKGKLISRYVMPKFGPEDMNKTADMIGQDIEHIYFNRTLKLPGLSFFLDKYGVTLHTRVDAGEYVYRFSGIPLKLIKKSMYENNRQIWSVDYYDYQKQADKEIPFKIFFKNYKYGYSIDIVTKEIKNERIQ